jgi:LCP family protein required for cell wall assembly
MPVSTFFPPETDRPADVIRRPTLRRRRPWLVGALLGLALVVVGAMAAAALYVGSIDQAVTSNLQVGEDLPPEVPEDDDEEPRPPKVSTDAVNYVIMGADTGSAGRSDVLMVAHLAADRQSAALISFPRDMWVDVPGHGKNKINAAYAFGGPQLTVRTLEGLLGTRMDHTVQIDFEGFVQVTRDLGGVTVDNPHYSRTGPWEFPVGRITLEGDQALAYVRERKQLPRGDLDRAERQRLVAQAILRQALSPEVIANPPKFNRIVGSVAKQVTVDRGLTGSEVRKTALSVRFKPDEIASLQAPISGFGTSKDGQSIDVVDEAKLDALADALRKDDLRSYLGRYPRG